MSPKMTRAQFVGLFASPDIILVDRNDPDMTTRATSKQHKHNHNPAAKPSTGKITPAQYRRNSKKKSTKETK